MLADTHRVPVIVLASVKQYLQTARRDIKMVATSSCDSREADCQNPHASPQHRTLATHWFWGKSKWKSTIPGLVQYETMFWFSVPKSFPLCAQLNMSQAFIWMGCTMGNIMLMGDITKKYIALLSFCLWDNPWVNN